MNYYHKLQNLFKMQEFVERRLNHIEMEKMSDMELSNSSKQCPHLVVKFFLVERHIRRKLARKTYNAGMFDYADRIKHNLDVADRLYGKNLDPLRFSCKNLSETIAHMKKYT